MPGAFLELRSFVEPNRATMWMDGDSDTERETG